MLRLVAGAVLVVVAVVTTAIVVPPPSARIARSRAQCSPEGQCLQNTSQQRPTPPAKIVTATEA